MTEENQKILDALMALDITNDEHWTNSGLPAIAAVEQIAGIDTTRRVINELAPDFERDNTAMPEQKNEPAVEAEVSVKPVVAEEQKVEALVNKNVPTVATENTVQAVQSYQMNSLAARVRAKAREQAATKQAE